jgi:iron-sulfur cluster repair protein YtfE (RIC family)
MDPSQVRERVLADHRALRHMLERVEVLARHVLQGKHTAVEKLDGQVRTLDERMREHMALEERILVPALRQADAWGKERVERFHAEHERQRKILASLWRDSPDDAGHGMKLALLAWGLVRLLQEDMADEERVSLNADVLRDDPIQTRVETD